MNIEKAFTESNALLSGHFLLTSGLHSPNYLQCAQLLQNPKYANPIAAEIASFYPETTLVIGPATGGIVLATYVGAQLAVRNIFSERVEGKMSLRRGFTIFPADKVLIVEDVVTTGGSVLEVVELVHSSGAELIGVASIVNRSGKKSPNPEFTNYRALYTINVQSYAQADCPLCQEGALPAIKPGSRNIS